ncbi:unnamed protein product [Discula destructiva]
MADTTTTDTGVGAPFPLPRVTIKFCTQCKWNLRAAYFAQELLSTFSTSLGEVALQPSTGGTFIVEIFHHSSSSFSSTSPTSPTSPSPPPIPSHPHIAATILWDRKTDGGFPETKELKRRVRDVIEPGRNLGHVDRDHPKPAAAASAAAAAAPAAAPAAADKDAKKEETRKEEQGISTEEKGGAKECEDCS